MARILMVAVAFAVFTLFTGPAVEGVEAFMGQGCMGECSDCHTLTKDEATKLLKTDRFRADIKDIRMSPVKGLWEVEVIQGDKNILIYMDFGKKFLIEARFTELEQLEEQARLKKVDRASIPLDKAVVLGNPDAEKKVIIFDDPECPYCAKLHGEVKKILAERDDIAFYVKMYPLPSHPNAYGKSKAVVCSGSADMLDDAFAGKPLPEPDCETDEVDNNIKLAQELGVKGTPVIIFPDGRMLPGYVPADVLLWHMDNP
jgi:thiol:disulfide interchange protein DsbC